MPNYTLTAVNVGAFSLGESDRVITLFSAERGLTRGVAKGARKPGSKIAGRADLLNVNKLMLASGRSLDIITQAQQIESFPNLRKDLVRLAYGLYYAELAAQFGQGLSDEAEEFFQLLCAGLRELAAGDSEPALLCLEFEMSLLELLGYKPELDCCVVCRDVLTDSTVAAFDHELGGIVCQRCFVAARRSQPGRVAEDSSNYGGPSYGEPALQHFSVKTHVTPLVWQGLILAAQRFSESQKKGGQLSANAARAYAQGCRLIQTYIEHKAGRKMKALDLIRV